MPLYDINSFDDVRFITLVMRSDRLEKMKDTYLQALIYWSEEISEHVELLFPFYSDRTVFSMLSLLQWCILAVCDERKQNLAQCLVLR